MATKKPAKKTTKKPPAKAAAKTKTGPSKKPPKTKGISAVDPEDYAGVSKDIVLKKGQYQEVPGTHSIKFNRPIKLSGTTTNLTATLTLYYAKKDFAVSGELTATQTTGNKAVDDGTSRLLTALMNKAKERGLQWKKAILDKDRDPSQTVMF